MSTAEAPGAEILRSTEPPWSMLWSVPNARTPDARPMFQSASPGRQFSRVTGFPPLHAAARGVACTIRELVDSTPAMIARTA